MIIMSQDNNRLINSDNVEDFHIEDDLHIYATLKFRKNKTILLGSYNEADHARHSLYFIASCLVDEEAKDKITRLPASDDFKPSTKSTGQSLLEAIKQSS